MMLFIYYHESILNKNGLTSDIDSISKEIGDFANKLNIDKKYIITCILLIIILLPIMYFFVLPDHAKSRIEVFLDQYSDPRGAGYNIIQSKLAIGAGELFGMGLLNGNQTQLRLFIS